MSKTPLTITCETIFASAYRAALNNFFAGYGRKETASVWQEHRIKGESTRCRDKIIDFAVGFGKQPDDEDFDADWSNSPTLTGCELKTQVADFKTECGINFSSYHYNYLITPRERLYEAEKLLKLYPHVGLLLVNAERNSVEYVKAATYIDIDLSINTEGDNNLNVAYDSVKMAFDLEFINELYYKDISVQGAFKRTADNKDKNLQEQDTEGET